MNIQELQTQLTAKYEAYIKAKEEFAALRLEISRMDFDSPDNPLRVGDRVKARRHPHYQGIGKDEVGQVVSIKASHNDAWTQGKITLVPEVARLTKTGKPHKTQRLSGSWNYSGFEAWEKVE